MSRKFDKTKLSFANVVFQIVVVEHIGISNYFS